MPEVKPPEPTRFGEIVWLEPYPDPLLEGAINVPLGPDACYEQTEAISLAFVTALQVLPARQRAVLILREVLGYHADEVADMLDSTVESVNSTAGSTDKTLKLYDGHLHDLLNDLDKESVMADIRGWIEARLAVSR